MKNKTIILPESGKEVIINTLTYGVSDKIGQQALEFREGQFVLNPFKMRKLGILASCNLNENQLDNLDLNDSTYLFSEVDALAEGKEIQKKSQEQSPQAKPKTTK